MPSKVALLDYAKCRPAQCGDGLCPASQACRYKLISQEQPYETPMMGLFTCRGCGDCMAACPLQAIEIART